MINPLTRLKKGWGSVVVEATLRWFRHGAPTMSAAMAFYTLTSLAPLLLIAMSIAGSILGPEEVRAQLSANIAAWLDPSTAGAVEGLLQGEWLPESGVVVSVLAGGAFLFTSTLGFEHLRDSLNRVWEAPPSPGLPLLALVRGRAVSFAFVLLLGFVLLATLVLRTVIGAVGSVVAPSSVLETLLIRGGDILTFLLGLSGMFALMFRFLPDAETPWRDALAGGTLTAGLFLAGEYAIGAYLTGMGIESAYGAVGSVVLLLFWIYYSSMVLFWGAEFTCVYAQRRSDAGSR